MQEGTDGRHDAVPQPRDPDREKLAKEFGVF
jgi:hypothetical protein